MLERVIELTAETLGADASSITETTSFTEDLHADSLDLFELAMALEEEFSVEIPSEDMEKITTVGDAIAYIEEHK
ncbi:MAG TPA: acyl carrier protein [Candidatus Blautia excrementipullorum]|nr:acyl carrier protein [Candidatus Blautia excrementipullorum]